LLSCAVTAGSLSDLRTQNPPPGEYEVKAAFLFNFAKFVEWPPDAFSGPDSPLVIGVIGEDPFGETLERTVAGKQAQGRPMEVRRWRRVEAVETCHILFVGDSQSEGSRSLVGEMSQRPVLTVGESETFAGQGGIIRFVLESNRVRFEINHQSAIRAGLRISSRLLALASHVWE
jgi:hypothetical protein